MKSLLFLPALYFFIPHPADFHNCLFPAGKDRHSVTIDLLAADAKTGATPIAFRKVEESQTGVYTFYNKTGETVLFINLIENGEEPATTLRYGFKDGLAPNAEHTLSLSVPANKKDVTLTLQFVTESGKIGIFNTLKIEEAPISLLDVDSVSGATPISFTAPQN